MKDSEAANLLTGKNVLITGGTGSFGNEFIRTVTSRYQPRKLIIFSRDELKQYEMQQKFNQPEHKCLRYFIGDLRDKDRLYRALDGVDIVIHAAALKQVPTAEYNPLEAIKTNVIGAANLIEAAIDRDVKQVIALSSDKAANPINLYGATKLCSDKLFMAANIYSGNHPTSFSVVRYGNVVGSRGSVIPFFLKMRGNDTIPVTDPRMTRFWITLRQGVDFVLDTLKRMQGGEVFIPKLPSMKIVDLANAIVPNCRIEVVGIRPGEKLHEVMIPEDEALQALEFATYYIIRPPQEMGWHWGYDIDKYEEPFSFCPDRFRYSSDSNSQWLTVEELREMVSPYEQDVPALQPTAH